ncbi:O-antigen ligase family protein [uncultured Roseibium sp.]|uniref:O-antigen ligase family protein n=1 Tax=uncultured Roseibium sp. TaxID=1936171 RepID=UPI003216AE13
MKLTQSPVWLYFRTKLSEANRWALLLVLVLLLLLKGGTPWPVAEVVSILIGLMLVFSSVEPPRNAAVARFQVYSLAFAVSVTMYILFQTLPISGLSNPIWDLVRKQLDLNLSGRISVAPIQSLWSIFRLVLPYAVFSVGLALFQFEKDVKWLWRAFSVIGTAFAIYGILQLLLFPDWLFLEAKTYYKTSLTSVLVNRNSAATFLGMALIATVCLIRWEVRSGERSGFWEEPWLQLGYFALSRNLGLLIGGVFLQVLALGLTTSRGGLLSSTLGLCVAVFLLDFRVLRRRVSNRVVKWGILTLLAIFAFELFSGRTVHRLETDLSSARLCTYKSTLQAALLNLPFGTGLGTFQDVFPSFRDPNCGVVGIWDKAHNSYLENFLELGLAYILFLGIGCILLLRTLVRGYGERQEYRPFVAGGLAITVLVAVHALVDFSLQIPAVSAFYALLLSSSVTIALGRSPRDM